MKRDRNDVTGQRRSALLTDKVPLAYQQKDQYPPSGAAILAKC